MIKYRQKIYAAAPAGILGSAKATGGKAVKWVKENPALALSGASLGVATGNFAINARRHGEAKKYQKQQLQAMDRLTKALGGVENSMRSYQAPPQVSKKKPSFLGISL
jgi:signal transduction protein with GAF and PtsI domain